MVWLVLVLVLGSSAALPAQPAPAPQGKIGYTGPDGNIYLVGTGGAPPAAVTSDAGENRAYRQVTWAPDGRKVAFVAYSQAAEGKVLAAVYTASADGGDPQEIYSTDAAAPFYLFWAPDGGRVSFLEVAGERLTLKIVPWQGGPAVVAGTGQPYYWDWMPDGRTLVTHTGGSSADNPRQAAISVLEPAGGGVAERARGPSPAFFQAPAAAPDGRSFAAAVLVPQEQNLLVRLGDPSMHLAVVDLQGAVVRSLAAIQGIAAFSWSPDGSRIALVDGRTTPIGGIVGPLVLVDSRKAAAVQPTGLEQVAFFSWSPDGKRLVAFVPRLIEAAEPVVVFGVFVVDAASGESRLAAVIRPTTEFLTGVAPFYDQYLRSSTLWSPDGKQVVLNGISEDGRSGVYLLDVDTRGPLRLLAEGTLPFWSPR